MMKFWISLLISVKPRFWHFKTGTDFVRRQFLTFITNYTYKKSSWLLSVLGTTLGDLWVKCLSKYWIFLEWSESVLYGKSFVLENLLFLHIKWKSDTGNDYWISKHTCILLDFSYCQAFLCVQIFFVSTSIQGWNCSNHEPCHFSQVDFCSPTLILQ